MLYCKHLPSLALLSIFLSRSFSSGFLCDIESDTRRYHLTAEKGDPLLVDIQLRDVNSGNSTDLSKGVSMAVGVPNTGRFGDLLRIPSHKYSIRIVQSFTERWLDDFSIPQAPPPRPVSPSRTSTVSCGPSVSSAQNTSIPTPPSPRPDPGPGVRLSKGGLAARKFSASILTLTDPAFPEFLTVTISSSATPAAAVTSTTGGSISSKFGPIVGVVTGCVVIIIVFTIIIWRRNGRTPKLNATNETENALPKPAPNGRLGSVRPFVLHPTNGSRAEIPGVYPFKHANQAGPPMQTSLGDAGSSSRTSNTISARAELLRQERGRINREIASLENRSIVSESRIPIAIRSINDQFAALSEQIRRIEQTYSQSAQAGVSEEPPPSYDITPSRTVIGGSRPLPTVVPPGDREGV